MNTDASELSAVAGRNIIIFSDGTGQRGGVFFDEARTNVYKLYRACRVAPDSIVPPERQLAFYDPGLGTLAEGGGTLSRLWRRFYNLVSQATGLGITRNIIDCYAAIIELWRPGDRIYLFGFSRGAYTVRCVATALSLSGIPTKRGGGEFLRRDPVSARKLAARAVRSVYQHVSSPKDKQFIAQRTALAAQFREHYECSTDANAYPFFIGVFDTVAALSNFPSLGVLAAVYGVLWLGSSFALDLLFGGSFAYWAAWLFFDTLCAAMAAYVYTHLKFSFTLPGFHWWETVHLTTFRQRFYDQALNPHVAYARHAISIDERRADFARVKWGDPKNFIAGLRMPRFEQIWFAGNHADIGGGYPENESRLSDIALQWMVSQAAAIELGDQRLIVDGSVLKFNPSPLGMQHDETQSFAFRFAGKSDRTPVQDAPLHPTVTERFHSKDGVQQYDVTASYRPEALRNHIDYATYYANIPLPHQTCTQRIRATFRNWRRTRTRSGRTPVDRLVLFLKGLRMDRIVSCLALAAMISLTLVGASIFVWQIWHWLQTDVWIPVPLERVASFVRVFGNEWVGLQRVYDWIFALPLSILSIVTGLILFGWGGSFSAQLYRRAALAERKPITPSQTLA